MAYNPILGRINQRAQEVEQPAATGTSPASTPKTSGYTPVLGRTQPTAKPAVAPQPVVQEEQQPRDRTVRLPFMEQRAEVGGGPVPRFAMDILFRMMEGFTVSAFDVGSDALSGATEIPRRALEKVTGAEIPKPRVQLPGPVYTTPNLFDDEVEKREGKFGDIAGRFETRRQQLHAQSPDTPIKNDTIALFERVLLPMLDFADVGAIASAISKTVARRTLSRPAQEALDTLGVRALDDMSETGVRRQVERTMTRNADELEAGRITVDEFAERQNTIGRALDTLSENPRARFGNMGSILHRAATALDQEDTFRRGVPRSIDESRALIRSQAREAGIRRIADSLATSVQDIQEGKTFGATYDVNARPYEGKDAIVTFYSESIPVADASPERIREILTQNQRAFGEDVKLGVFDMEDGTVSVDFNIALPNRQVAEALGRRFNQKAIYDANTGQVIDTGGTGDMLLTPEQVQETLRTAQRFNEDNPEVVESANKYMASRGREPLKSNLTFSFDSKQAAEIADTFDAMVDAPDNPRVVRAYNALAEETKAQYDGLIADGYKIEPWTGKGQPYENSAEMVADVRNNKHLYFFLTDEGFGSGVSANHPLLKESGVVVNDIPLKFNDLFRAVHDIYGHARAGSKFDAFGEENAWRNHSQMFSDWARRAMTTETRGQNSWVNFGKHLRRADGSLPRMGDPDYVSPANRPYAEQKTGLMPDKYVFGDELPRGNTRAENRDEYFRSEGYEPIRPDSELPTISAGRTPARQLDELPEVDIDTGEAPRALSRDVELTPEMQARLTTETRRLFGRGMDWETAQTTARERLLAEQTMPRGEAQVVPEGQTLRPARTPAREAQPARQAEAPARTQREEPRAERVAEEPAEVVEERVTTVPRENLPVGGSGETGVSGLEARMRGLMSDGNIARAERKAAELGIQTPMYEKMNKADQIRRAAEFVQEKPDDALAVLRGDRVAPEGLLHNSIALALAKHAENTDDAALAVRLASLRSTRAGQEISILTEADPIDVISNMNEIIQGRTARAARRLPKEIRKGRDQKAAVAHAIRTEVDEATQAILREDLKIEEAEKLLAEILC